MSFSDLFQVNGNNGELTTSQCAPSKRVARSEIPPGGVHNGELEDENVKLYLEEIITQINAGEGPDYE